MQSSGETKDLALLRQTFNADAEAYDRFRPSYPEQLFSDVIDLSGIPKGGQVIEIGCGTGKATTPFLSGGYKVTAVELGDNLAQFAKQKFKGFSDFKVVTGAFENLEFVENSFDLLISATAFHWVDPSTRYKKAWSCLRPGGAIALFWNEHVEGSQPEPFFEAVQRIYVDVVPELSLRYPGLLRPDKLIELRDYAREIKASGLFGPVTTKSYQWDVVYDSSSYIGLLSTFSDMIALEADRRKVLFDKIADLIDTKFSGKITKTYLTVLYIAKSI